MKKEMLINVLQSEECRIAIVEDGVLEELYVERASQENYVGNIYKGKIVNIEPSIQAAFVDFGVGRNGFLHVSDVDPAYYKHLLPRDVLARFEAGEDDGPPRNYGPRDGSRGRGDRREGSDRGSRPPRDREEPRRAAPEPARVDDSSDEEGGFGTGLGVETPATRHEYGEPESDARFDQDRGWGENTREQAISKHDREEIPAPVPPPQVVYADESADDGFGAGLEVDEPGRGEVVFFEETRVELVTEIGEEEPKARGRRKKKTDDSTPAEDEKPKARGRRKKKGEGDDEDREAPPVMGSAECRTFPDDEEEIKPFFEGGPADDFDVSGKNDRFAEGAEPTEPVIDLTPEPAAEFDFDQDLTVSDEGFAPPPRGRSNDRGGSRGRGGDRDRGGPSRGRAPTGRPGDRGPRRGPPPGPRPGGGRDRTFPRLPIEQIFKRGQEVIVQVIKEGIGTKGPTLSTFISIAGRYLVLMPSLNRFGVSRKIEDVSARRRLREIMNELRPPEGVGFIVRTAAIDRNKIELQNDLVYLLRLWQVVVRRIKKVHGAVEIYRESDIITRTIRDNFKADIDAIWVDDETAYTHASEFMQVVMPRYADRIKHFGHTEPLFYKFGVEEEIAKINLKRIEMPRGGSIIIEQTEALVAIDVNSGTFRAENNAEETAYQMNLLAAREIARQLRLRDLGGVIVNDFIDMRSESHRRNVENALRDSLLRDKARTKILRISQFGIIEMTRQRIQPSLKKRIYNDCTHCRGTGHVKTAETVGIELMRLLQLAAHKAPPVATVKVSVHPDVAFDVLNRKRRELAVLEDRAKIEIVLAGQPGASPETLDIKCYDANGTEVKLLGGGPPRLAAGRGPRNDRRHD
ncbi:MAG TPA: Rne/Rng family ribonuclease [Fimbriiglobus sp.]